MPDPISVGTALVKAASTAASSEPKKDTEKLIARLLGPAIDEFAAALARSVAYRTRNFGRIAEKASTKAGDDGHGIVHPRVAYSVLEDGSLCDDELMVEYLGGVLAGSRSPDGLDDRAITWCRCVSSMSWLQVKAHFLLYREWSAHLYGRTDVELGMNREQAMMHVELAEFASALVADADIPALDAAHHAIIGLVHLGLISDDFVIGDPIYLPARYHCRPPFEQLLITSPSMRGIELYGWAQGLPGLTADKFPTEAKVFATDPPIPRLTQIIFPRLPQAHPNQEAPIGPEP